jgi:hypothetical protein
LKVDDELSFVSSYGHGEEGFAHGVELGGRTAFEGGLGDEGDFVESFALDKVTGDDGVARRNNGTGDIAAHEADTAVWPEGEMAFLDGFGPLNFRKNEAPS